ncbi:MAG TPA: redoxin domain-containing protein [Anaerolineaceae bacterium]|nr:redoxin domain-containing protein [Anaerolineaceae bacterium]HPN50168.1 redoxin domain-containing protein [Anaerolineaceae bacterium]
MAQLRQDAAEFETRGAKVAIIGPDGPNAFRRYWETEQMPFTGLSDIGNKVADAFHQEVVWWKLGRMPAVIIVDQKGMIRYTHYGSSMSDIPENSELFEALDRIKTAS